MLDPAKKKRIRNHEFAKSKRTLIKLFRYPVLLGGKQ